MQSRCGAKNESEREGKRSEGCVTKGRAILPASTSLCAGGFGERVLKAVGIRTGGAGQHWTYVGWRLCADITKGEAEVLFVLVVWRADKGRAGFQGEIWAFCAVMAVRGGWRDRK